MIVVVVAGRVVVGPGAALAVVGGDGAVVAAGLVVGLVVGGQRAGRTAHSPGPVAADAGTAPQVRMAVLITMATATVRRAPDRDMSARDATLGPVTETSITSPARTDPTLDGDHERMAHIVLEGVTNDEGEYLAAGPSVVEGIVNGTAVRALCGKVWVPGRDPRRYPVCPTCQEIAESMGWDVPTS
jgi:hypothetical protein